MTEIYLIRHGEAEGNVFRRLHGQYNSLLMPRGYAQRKCLEKRFESIQIDGVFSSDLTRACLTSESVYVPKNLPLNRDKRFRELDVGVWEDLPFGYLDNFYPRDMHCFSHDPKNWRVQGSESYADYTERFIEGLKDVAQRYDGGTVAVFCHGAVLRGTLMRLFFQDCPDKLPISDNTGVSHLYLDKGRFSYEYLNDNSHIPAELSTFYIQAWWRNTDNRQAANLYFRPYDPKTDGPTVLEGDRIMTGMLCTGPVGAISLGKQQGTTGVILGIELSEAYRGRYYTEQFLGCAFSHFRHLGCQKLYCAPGEYPENVLERYAFDQSTRTRSLSNSAYPFTL